MPSVMCASTGVVSSLYLSTYIVYVDLDEHAHGSHCRQSL